MRQMDFSVIIPKMREAILEYMNKKSDQGKNMSEREATVKWLDRYYDSWLQERVGDTPEITVGGAEEKRKATRVPIEISAYYRVLWTPNREAPKSSDMLPAEMAKVENISASGLYIVTGKSYPISTLMEIQFELLGITESISAFSMVVWRSDQGNGRYGHGLHFSHIETHNADLLNVTIMERLLDAPVVSVK